MRAAVSREATHPTTESGSPGATARRPSTQVSSRPASTNAAAEAPSSVTPWVSSHVASSASRSARSRPSRRTASSAVPRASAVSVQSCDIPSASSPLAASRDRAAWAARSADSQLGCRPLRRRGGVVQLVSETCRERAQGKQPVAVSLERRDAGQDRDEDAHHGLEHRGLGDEEHAEGLRLDEEQPGDGRCPGRSAQALAGEQRDRPEVPTGVVVKKRQLIAADVDRGLELALEQQPPEPRLIAAAEDVLADVVRPLGAVACELLEPLVRQVGEYGDPAELAGLQGRHESLRYLCTSSTAIEPSPTAEATRLIDWSRTSPAAKTPGMLVSSANGSRCFSGQGGHPLGTSSTCSPVRMNPRSERAGALPSQSVCGSAPTKTNIAVAGTRETLPGLVDRDLLQLVLSVRLAHLRPQPHGDLVGQRLDAVDEVLRHRLLEALAAIEDRHMRRAGEMERGLPGGVRAADDEGFLTVEEGGVARRGRAVPDAASGEAVGAHGIQPAIRDTRGEQHRVGGDGRTVGEPNDARASDDVDADSFLRGQELGAEAAGLCRRAAREVGSGEAGRETEVVLDARAHAGLAAERLSLDDDRSQPFRCAVDGGGEPGGAGADDDEVVVRELLVRLEADPLREARRGRG